MFKKKVIQKCNLLVGIGSEYSVKSYVNKKVINFNINSFCINESLDSLHIQDQYKSMQHHVCFKHKEIAAYVRSFFSLGHFGKG